MCSPDPVAVLNNLNDCGNVKIKDLTLLLKGLWLNFFTNVKGGVIMAHSSLWGAPIKVKLKADEVLQEYVPGLAENEIVTGTEIVKLKEDNMGCTIEINDREIWLSEREANKIYVGWVS